MPIGEISRNKPSSAKRKKAAPMELEEHVFFLCTQVVYRRTSLLHAALRPMGMLPTEYRVLSAVLRKGPLAMQDLAQWTAYERTRLTHLLRAMEERGWVERTSSETDRRTVLVQITALGEAQFVQAKKEVDTLTDVILSDNTQEEIDQVRRALSVMRRKLIELEDAS